MERKPLQLGRHPSRPPQADWRTRGPTALAFEVMVTLAPPELSGYDPAADRRPLAAMWRDRLAPAAAAGTTPRPMAAESYRKQRLPSDRP